MVVFQPSNTPKRPLPEEEINKIQENETDCQRQKKLRQLDKARVHQIQKKEQEQLNTEEEKLAVLQRRKLERQEMVEKLVDINLTGFDVRK